MWDAETWSPIGDFMKGHTKEVIERRIQPDGERIVSGGADGTMRLWDAESRQPIGEPMLGHRGRLRGSRSARMGGSYCLGQAGTGRCGYGTRNRGAHR